MTEPEPDRLLDYLSEADLQDRGIDLDAVEEHCPHAMELRALDNTRCWFVLDLTPLLEGTTHE